MWLAAHLGTSLVFDCENCVMIITKGTSDVWGLSQDC